MSSNTNQPASGVAGNTSPQLNAASGPAATTARATTWQKHKKKIVLILAAIALVTGVLVYTSSGVRIGGVIVTGLIIRHVGMKFGKNPDMSWGSILGYVGTVIIVVAVLSSSFVQKPLEWFNTAEAGVAGGTLSLGSSCTDVHRVTAGDEFVLSRVCGTDGVRVPASLDPKFGISDARFAGAFHDWVSSPWDKHDNGLLHLTVLRWPEGVNEVTVRVYTPAEAAEIDANVSEPSQSQTTEETFVVK